MLIETTVSRKNDIKTHKLCWNGIFFDSSSLSHISTYNEVILFLINIKFNETISLKLFLRGRISFLLILLFYPLFTLWLIEATLRIMSNCLWRHCLEWWLQNDFSFPPTWKVQAFFFNHVRLRHYGSFRKYIQRAHSHNIVKNC